MKDGTESPTGAPEAPRPDDTAPPAGGEVEVVETQEAQESEGSPFEKHMAKLRAELEEESAEPAEVPDDEPAEPVVDGELEEESAEPAPAAAEEEAGDEALADYVFVALPGRREEDGDFELPLDKAALEAAGIDPKDAEERVRQLKNGFVRGEQLRARQAELDDADERINGIFDELEADPAGFLTSGVKPEVRLQVAEELLLQLDQQSFDALLDRVDEWTRNPAARDVQRTKKENDRLKQSASRSTEAREQARVQREVREIHGSIVDLIPPELTDARADVFVRAAATELQLYAKEKKLSSLDPSKVPEILADRGVLEAFNISPNGGGNPSEAPGSRSGNGDGSKKPSSAAATKKPAAGEDVRDRMKRRKAATTTPAGAGATPSGGFTKVKGESYLERRNRIARAEGLPEKKAL